MTRVSTTGPRMRQAWWLWPIGMVREPPEDSGMPVSSHTGQITSRAPSVSEMKLA